jgi:hypothetical protein
MRAMKTNTHNLLKDMVGAPGFEPGASCAQGRRATRLRYAPTMTAVFILEHSEAQGYLEPPSFFFRDRTRMRSPLVVQYDAQEGAVDLQAVFVVDKTHLFEFVHEEIHAGARCADHFRQRFLRHLGKDSLRLVILAITG